MEGIRWAHRQQGTEPRNKLAAGRDVFAFSSVRGPAADVFARSVVPEPKFGYGNNGTAGQSRWLGLDEGQLRTVLGNLPQNGVLGAGNDNKLYRATLPGGGGSAEPMVFRMAKGLDPAMVQEPQILPVALTPVQEDLEAGGIVFPKAVIQETYGKPNRKHLKEVPLTRSGLSDRLPVQVIPDATAGEAYQNKARIAFMTLPGRVQMELVKKAFQIFVQNPQNRDANAERLEQEVIAPLIRAGGGVTNVSRAYDQFQQYICLLAYNASQMPQEAYDQAVRTIVAASREKEIGLDIHSYNLLFDPFEAGGKPRFRFIDPALGSQEVQAVQLPVGRQIVEFAKSLTGYGLEREDLGFQSPQILLTGRHRREYLIYARDIATKLEKALAANGNPLDGTELQMLRDHLGISTKDPGQDMATKRKLVADSLKKIGKMASHQRGLDEESQIALGKGLIKLYDLSRNPLGILTDQRAFPGIRPGENAVRAYEGAKTLAMLLESVEPLMKAPGRDIALEDKYLVDLGASQACPDYGNTIFRHWKEFQPIKAGHGVEVILARIMQDILTAWDQLPPGQETETARAIGAVLPMALVDALPEVNGMSGNTIVPLKGEFKRRLGYGQP